jgi:soluble lytic murein transglycosylase
VVALLIVGGLAAYGLSRIDFGETIRDLTLPLDHEGLIREEAGDEDVAKTAAEGEISLPATDPALIAAVINAESGFRDRTSRAGARGLMQITHDTADTIEKLSGGETFEYDDLADPELNIRYGSFYLRYLLHLFDGNETAALTAYNAGPGNAWDWGGTSLEVEDIRFPETRAYVEKVLAQRRDYRRTYGDELGF